jgi:Glycosyl hydrolase family 20, catalytic domain
MNKHTSFSSAVLRAQIAGLALLSSLAFILSGCKSGEPEVSKSQDAWLKSWRTANPVWRGVHFSASSDANLAQLEEQLPRLTAASVNVIILEVDYNFEFQSHPELRPSHGITRARAREAAAAARAAGVRLIPQINCLGHQSWAKTTDKLLTKYPQFDETPGQFPENQGIYCRSWCPQNPELHPVVFALIDEIIDAFQADAFHVGMDEVFLMASDPAKLFAKEVNALHGHIVGQRKIEMLMWGDRLLDAKALGYSRWEAATNGTAAAIDMIPKDIIVCDWHYGESTNYPSVPLLLEKGFRVWPSGWQPLEAAKAFSAYSHQQKNPRLIGYLCTTWGKAKIANAAEWPPLTEVLRDWK